MPDKQTLAVNILDKEYLVAGPQEASHELERSARYLDSKMREIRASGRVFGVERIAVMAALNITHEMLQKDTLPPSASALLDEMDQRLDQALAEGDSGNTAETK